MVRPTRLHPPASALVKTVDEITAGAILAQGSVKISQTREGRCSAERRHGLTKRRDRFVEPDHAHLHAAVVGVDDRLGDRARRERVRLRVYARLCRGDPRRAHGDRSRMHDERNAMHAARSRMPDERNAMHADRSGVHDRKHAMHGGCSRTHGRKHAMHGSRSRTKNRENAMKNGLSWHVFHFRRGLSGRETAGFSPPSSDRAAEASRNFSRAPRRRRPPPPPPRGTKRATRSIRRRIRGKRRRDTASGPNAIHLSGAPSR